MDNKVNRFRNTFILFIIGQFFLILGLLSYGSHIKALASWLELFAFFDFLGIIFIIIVASRLYSYNKHYFHFLISSIIYLFIGILGTICLESTSDLTVAWGRGLNVSAGLLLCLVYVYFFLGTRDYFKENNLYDNVKKSRIGCIIVIAFTIISNIMSFIRTFDTVKTNYIASAILKYGSMFFKLVIYIFILVVLISMIVYMHKHKKEVEPNEATE